MKVTAVTVDVRARTSPPEVLTSIRTVDRDRFQVLSNKRCGGNVGCRLFTQLFSDALKALWNVQLIVADVSYRLAPHPCAIAICAYT